MPAPIPDLSRDQQCHHYQAPTGQRCGSPALKGEYYCYHHHIKHANRNSRRILIDPEITCMEIPPIEDRASIFTALAAVLHRLAENTIDTRRAGQMIYGLQVAMRALEPPRTATNPGARGSSPLHRDDPGVTPTASVHDEPAADTADSTSTASDPATQPATNNQQLATPRTISITKESLLYFLRSRHCYNCNAELFPASELTERRNPGAPPEVIEEAQPSLPAPVPRSDDVVILSGAKNPRISPVPPQIDEPLADNGGITLNASAVDLDDPTSNWPETPPAIHTRAPALLYTHLGARYPRDLRAQFRRILAYARHGPHRILNRRQTGERNGSS